MSRRALFLLLGIAAVVAVVAIAGTWKDEGVGGASLVGAQLAARIDEAGEVALSVSGAVSSTTDEALQSTFQALLGAGPNADVATLVIDYPFDGSLFPPEMVAPSFLWHDGAEATDAWLVEVAFAEGKPLHLFVPGKPPPRRPIDEEVLGPTNVIWLGTPYEQSARSWTPSEAVWQEIKRRTIDSRATVTLRGFATAAPDEFLSSGRMELSTSSDPVGAPIFYRDVPLMPNRGESGVIKPLKKEGIPLIAWRLKDVARHDSKVVLTGMPSCANCHSFSLDGKTLGMDIDGPQGDKGTYAIVKVAKDTVVEPENVITWNAFEDKPEGHKTIGFLTRMSPDGRYAITTLNESLYVSNFTDFQFLQVFYPTRGILAWYSTDTGDMKALPGADDTEYVHTNGVWSPDGGTIVFSRAKAFDPYQAGQDLATRAGDPSEPRIRYNLCRMPFDEGRGGTPEPIEGASHNGMSNTFPKVSPDGKWVVWTKCRNGQLMRPDGRLWIVPFEGGQAREMRCNLGRMNSWHSFSPNSRWLVFSSKAFSPYTQMFLTHIDEEGNDTPAILVPGTTAGNRAVNIPEFFNGAIDDFDHIVVPAVNHHRHLAHGVDLMKSGDVDEAIAAFEKALELEPDFSRAHTNLGQALVSKGRINEGIRHFEKAIEVNVDDAFAWDGLGNALGRKGLWKEAIQVLEKALSVGPLNPYIHNHMGLARQATNQDDLALRHFERAVALHPGFLEARKNLGYALLGRGRAAEALVQYEAALDIDDDDVVAHSSTGRILLEQGEVARATPHLERAVSLSPDDVSTRVALGWILATRPEDGLRDGKRAVEVATEACELTGWEEPGPLDVLAAAYAEAGRFPEAVSTAKRAQTLAEQGRGRVGAGLDERLRLYEHGRPYRQSKSE